MKQTEYTLGPCPVCGAPRHEPRHGHGVEVEQDTASLVRTASVDSLERWIKSSHAKLFGIPRTIKFKRGRRPVDLAWLVEITPEQEGALAPTVAKMLQALREYHEEHKPKKGT